MPTFSLNERMVLDDHGGRVLAVALDEWKKDNYHSFGGEPIVQAMSGMRTGSEVHLRHLCHTYSVYSICLGWASPAR